MDAIAGNWRKSSYSAANGNCLEAGNWRKSSRSMSNGHCAEIGTLCAEVGDCSCGVAVRDSKLGQSPVLIFAAGTWSAFTAAVRTGTVGH